MAVRQRGGSYQVDVQVTIAGGEKERFREDYKTEVEAVEREAEIKAAALRGLPVPPRRDTNLRGTGHTLQDAQKAAWQDYWKDDNAARNAWNVSEQVVKYFGPLTQLTAITDDKVKAFVIQLERERNSDATINRKLASLSKMYAVAIEKRWCVESDRPLLKRRKEGNRREYIVSHEEEDTIVSTFKVWGMDDMADLTVTLLDTGARPWLEIPYRLEWPAINFKTDTLTIFNRKSPTGGKVNTTLPMTARVAGIMMRRKAEGKRKPFEFRTYREMNVQWEKLRAHLGKADESGFVMYALRHTCGVRLAEAGHTLIEIAEWLGHSRTSTTERYARHMTASGLARLRDSLTAGVEAAKPGRLKVLDGGLKEAQA